MTKITVPKELVDLVRTSEDRNQFDDLTPRELDVIHLLVKGMSNREIWKNFILQQALFAFIYRIYMQN